MHQAGDRNHEADGVPSTHRPGLPARWAAWPRCRPDLARASDLRTQPRGTSRQHDFDSWKTWERGAPELAFEILSPSDSPERWTFEEKLPRYRACGVSELVVFHADGEPGSRLRVWDRIDGDLVKRTVTDEATPCLTLDAHLVVASVDGLPACVRLARDPEGADLFPTEKEVRLREADARREAEARLREAEKRIAELEASRVR